MYSNFKKTYWLVVFIVFFTAVSQVYASDTWENVSPSGTNGYAFNAVATAEEYVYVATDHGVYRSVDNGTNWVAMTGISGNVTSLAIGFLYNSGSNTYTVSSSTLVFAGTPSGVYASTLNGTAWTATSAGLTDTNVFDIEIDQNEMTQGNLTTLYVATPSGVFRSTDQASHWTAENPGLTGITIAKLASDYGNGVIYALSTTSNKIYSSALKSVSGTDESWSQVFDGGSTSTKDVSIEYGHGFITWKATGNGILKSDDTGTSTTQVNTGLGTSSLTVNNVASDYNDPNIAYAAMASKGVYRTTCEANTGVCLSNAQIPSWLPINQSLSDLAISDVITNPVNSKVVFATGASGVYRLQLSSTYADLTPPSAITDLTASTSANNSYTLHWSAPGGDGTYGTSTSYDIRFATSTITDTSWATATPGISGTPTPAVSGTRQSYLLTNATSTNITYYFAIKSSDGFNNSALSNIAIHDATIPTITGFAISTTTSNSLTEHITVNTFTATDNVGVTGYQITQSPTAPASDDSHWEGIATTTYTLSCPPQNLTVFVCSATLYAWAKDNDDNVSTGTAKTVNITVTNPAPVITAFTADPTAVNKVVNITAFTATDDVAVTGYFVSDSPATPAASDPGWTVTPPPTFTFNQGLGSFQDQSLYAWAKDGDGNVSAATSQVVFVPDITPPSDPTGLTAGVISTSEIDIYWHPSSDNADNNLNYAVTRNGVSIGTASDNFGGTVYYYDTGLSSNTSYTYTVRAYDNSGNYSNPVSVSATTNAASVNNYSSGGGGGESYSGGGAPPAYNYPTASTTASTTPNHAVNYIPVPEAFFALHFGVTSPNVMQLQKFLNSHGFIVAVKGNGSPGHETTYYGSATQTAWDKFMAYEKTLTLTASVPGCPISIICTAIAPSPKDSTLAKLSAIKKPVTVVAKGADVLNLQKFLNSHGFLVSAKGNGSPGHESNYYGTATARAVAKFQQKYAKDILTPYGLTKGTGIVGPTTLKKINALIAVAY